MRKIALEGNGFYEDLHWSPDGSLITYTDNSWSLYVLDVESGGARPIMSEPHYGPQKTIAHSWSPDSRWLAYTRATEADFRQVWLYSIADGSYAISRSMYFYVKGAHVGVIPGIEDYIDVFTQEATWGDEGILTDLGLIPLPAS